MTTPFDKSSKRFTSGALLFGDGTERAPTRGRHSPYLLSAPRSLACILALAGAACGESDTGGDPVCTPGKAEECACADGTSGAQVCLPDGTFDICVCTAPDAGPGGDAASSDAGTDDDGPVSDAGAGDGGACPDDMVAIGDLGVCIDRYEASKSPTGKPESKPGRMPWVNVTHADATAACKSAGKRLCDGPEWLAACHGPSPGKAYPYGDTFDPQACNGMEYSIAHGTYEAVMTGSLGECVGGHPGIFDMSGNVTEITSDCNGADCPSRGGFWIDDSQGLRCDRVMNGTGTGWNVGFRCCVTLAGG